MAAVILFKTSVSHCGCPSSKGSTLKKKRCKSDILGLSGRRHTSVGMLQPVLLLRSLLLCISLCFVTFCCPPHMGSKCTILLYHIVIHTCLKLCKIKVLNRMRLKI